MDELHLLKTYVGCGDLKVLGEPVPNRFHRECSKEYKEWLKNNLPVTIEPGPNVPHIIADVGAKHQV